MKFTQGCYSTPNSHAGLSGRSLNTIVGQDGYFFMGTDSGLIVCSSSWDPITNELTEMLDGRRIRHIIADKSGFVWIASYSDTPVIKCDPETWDITCFTQ